jgi:hypothetical protein
MYTRRAVVLGVCSLLLGSCTRITGVSVSDRSEEGALNKSIFSGGTLSGVTAPSPTATGSASPVPTDSPSEAPIATGRDLFPEAVEWKTVDCEWPTSSFTEDLRIRQIWTVRAGQGILGIGIYCQSYSGDAGMVGRFPRSSIRFVSQFPDDSPTGSGGGSGTGLPGAERGFGTGSTLPSDGGFGTGFDTGDDDDDPFDEGLGTPFEGPTFTPGGGGSGPGGDTTGGTSGGSSTGGSSGTPTATHTPVPLSTDEVTWLDGTDPEAGEVDNRNEEGLDPVAFLMSPEGSVVGFGSACSDSDSCSGSETVYETDCESGAPIRGLSVGFSREGVIVGVVARRKAYRVVGFDCQVRMKATEARSMLRSLPFLWN